MKRINRINIVYYSYNVIDIHSGYKIKHLFGLENIYKHTTL